MTLSGNLHYLRVLRANRKAGKRWVRTQRQIENMFPDTVFVMPRREAFDIVIRRYEDAFDRMVNTQGDKQPPSPRGRYRVSLYEHAVPKYGGT